MADRHKLEVHRDLIEGLQSRLTTEQPAACFEPDEPVKGPGNVLDFDGVNQVQGELIAALFACDVTRVVHLKLATWKEKTGYAGQGAATIHNGLHHGSNPYVNVKSDAQQGYTDWCADNAKMVADLAATLDSIPEEDGTMLDNTIVLWTTELGTGWHELGWLPYTFIGGGNCGLIQGQFKHYGQDTPLPKGGTSYNGNAPDFGRSLVGPAHNHLLVSLCHAMGLNHMDFVGQETLHGKLDVRGPLSSVAGSFGGILR